MGKAREDEPLNEVASQNNAHHPTQQPQIDDNPNHLPSNQIEVILMATTQAINVFYPLQISRMEAKRWTLKRVMKKMMMTNTTKTTTNGRTKSETCPSCSSD